MNTTPKNDSLSVEGTSKTSGIPNLSLRKPRIGVFIIAYNAVNHLIQTISRIPKDVYESVEEIFVIDDCSRDNTYYAALGYKHAEGIEKLTVHRNVKNQRYGGNQKVGYRYAIDRGFDIVALVHGDGQYAPEALGTLLEPLVNGSADMVFGSRMSERGQARKGGMPLYKFVGNRILTSVQNYLSDQSLSEYHSGYRLYSVAALKQIPFQTFTDTWHFDTEIILALRERNMRIVERPIPTYYGDEICHVNGMGYAAHCIYTTYKFAQLRRRGEFMFPGTYEPFNFGASPRIAVREFVPSALRA